MQLTEGVKPSFEDRKELERNIRDLAQYLESTKNVDYKCIESSVKEYRRLRRMRHTEEE